MSYLVSKYLNDRWLQSWQDWFLLMWQFVLKHELSNLVADVVCFFVPIHVLKNSIIQPCGR